MFRNIITISLLLTLFSAPDQKKEDVVVEHVQGRPAKLSLRSFTKMCDSIEVIFRKKYVHILADSQSLGTKSDTSGLYSIQFPDIETPALINIRFYKKRTDGNLIMLSGPNSNFYIMPGDNITGTFNLLPDSSVDVDFSGKGSDKFTCIQELDREYEKFHQQRTIYYKTYGVNNFDHLDTLSTIFHQFAGRLEKILSNRKRGIEKEVFEVIRYEKILGPMEFDWQAIFFTALFNLSRKPKVTDTWKDRVRIYEQNKDAFKFSVDQINPSLSPFTLMSLLMRERTKVLAETRRDINDSTEGISPFRTVFRLIKNNYHGEVKEWLLASLLLNYGNNALGLRSDEFYEISDEAISMIKEESLLDILNRQINFARKGRKAYDFSLPDSSGRVISLAALRGKVVLMDMWFYPCTGCLWFSQTLKQVYPSFKDRKDFVVVSINADSDKERWLKALQGGLYSSKNYINVHTETGFDHPLINYYKLTGLPFVLLIDKEGNIFENVVLIKDAVKLQQSIESALSEDQ